MLTEICAEIRNYFLVPNGIHSGTFTISGGSIAPLDFLKDGQYYRIVGSTFNDGVHMYPDFDLTDEQFEGSVWAMAVPPAVVALSEEIKAFTESDAGKPTPYTSESFANYSYTRASDANGVPVSWQSLYAKRLNPYRRISVL